MSSVRGDSASIPDAIMAAVNVRTKQALITSLLLGRLTRLALGRPRANAYTCARPSS